MASTALPETMRRIHFTGPGGPEVIAVETAPLPSPGPGQVLIEVVAAGVNRPDVMQRAGLYPPPPGATEIPGLEVAGRVAALGEGVDTLTVGEEVCALVISGGYAEFAVAEASHCLPRPKALSLVDAAGLPETFFTVYSNVVQRGRLAKGESFLVHGGSSGIGATAIQIAKHVGAGSSPRQGRPRSAGSAKSSGPMRRSTTSRRISPRRSSASPTGAAST